MAPAAAVNHTLDAADAAVPRAILLPVVQEEPPPGAPGASPAAYAAGTPKTSTTTTTAPIHHRLMPTILRRHADRRKPLASERTPPSERQDVQPVGDDERAGAAVVHRAGDPQPERVRAG